MKRALNGLLVVAFTAVLGMTGLPSAGAVPATSMVLNGTSVSIGVIHVWDGDYTVPQKYDQLLKWGERTDQWWSSASGVYIGPGYCVNVSTRPKVMPGDNGTGWNYTTTWPARSTATQYYLSGNQSYLISAFPAGTC